METYVILKVRRLLRYVYTIIELQKRDWTSDFSL
jgi:hypothetical protein